MHRKYRNGSTADRDWLQERVDDLEHRMSVVWATVVVLLALLVAAAVLLYPVFESKKAEWESALNAKQVYPTHIVEETGKMTMKSINQFRSDRELTLIKEVPETAREVLAAWTGCVINRYSLEPWAEEDCTALVPYSDGYTVHWDLYEWEVAEGDEGGLTADEDAPTPADIMSKIKKDYNDSRAEEDSETTPPNVLSKDTQMSKVYVVGSGGEKWQVYIFSIQKTA